MKMDRECAADILRLVERVLSEDLGSGDLTAGLLPSNAGGRAEITTREAMTLAGRPWVDALFERLDTAVSIHWHAADGDPLSADGSICRLEGPAQALLSGERAALNLLQTLSATATETARYVEAVAGTNCQILDTRKTVPGLRLAQKYAVRCGGGRNHRIGLFDAILIKENHIMAAGGIGQAIKMARDRNPGVPVEVEVENADELREAFDARAERVLVDNFTHDALCAAVAARDAHTANTELEASGNVTLETVRSVAETGVDFVSVGALTKHLKAIDLSMRFSTGSTRS